MAYVPPHLRNKQNVALQAKSTPRSLEALQKSTAESSNPTYTLDDISAALDCNKNNLSTLTVARQRLAETSEEPDQNLDRDTLRAFMLFEGQHPEWRSEHKILCKSNLHVLHKLSGEYGDQNDESTSCILPVQDSDGEYPLFQEIPFMKRKFDFGGWWRIQTIAFVAPRSAELVALFEKKFNSQNGCGHNSPFSQRGKTKARTEEAWRDGLSREWAVVTLVKSHARKDRPEIPAKQRTSNDERMAEKSSHLDYPGANPTIETSDCIR